MGTKHQYAEDKAKEHEKGAKEDGTFFKHIGGTGTESLVCHSGTESGTKPLLLRTLHKHKQQEQGRNNQQQSKDKVCEEC